jgi:D-alanine transaminase
MDNGCELLYLNGSFLPLAEGRISVQDRGFQFGDGLYEVVRFNCEKLLWLDEHLARLAEGLRKVGIDHEGPVAQLAEAIPAVVDACEAEEGFVYAQVTRGVAPRDFVVDGPGAPTVLAYARPWSRLTWEQVEAGCTVYPLEDFRWSRCDIKTIGLLAAVMGKETAERAGAADVLWVGPDGSLRESGSGNFFALVDGIIRTHPADNHILDGVTRQKAIKVMRELDLELEERAPTLQELKRADEAFLTSTKRDVLPVLAVGEIVIGSGMAGPVALRLGKALREVIDRVCG